MQNLLERHIETIFKKEFDWYVFQQETGEEGTPHLQGTVNCFKTKRLKWTEGTWPQNGWWDWRMRMGNWTYVTVLVWYGVFGKTTTIRQTKCPALYPISRSITKQSSKVGIVPKSKWKLPKEKAQAFLWQIDSEKSSCHTLSSQTKAVKASVLYCSKEKL